MTKKKNFKSPQTGEYLLQLEAGLLSASAIGNQSLIQAAGQENGGEYSFEEFEEYTDLEWFE